jgi:hypothetical protein
VALFPPLPERTRLFRLFATHQAWADRFLAAPTVLGIADSYGIELRHPRRHGRSTRQIGKKGLSNGRWIVGGKLGVVVTQWGRIAAWGCATATVYDATFHPLLAQFDEQMVVLADSHFHAHDGEPANVKICARGTWPERMLIETVLSVLTRICQLKQVGHRVWTYFQARLAVTVAVFNRLADWHGLQPDEQGIVHLSIAEFSL